METNKGNTSGDKQWVNKIHCGDAFEILKTMPDESVDCVVTSPPYWGLRDYGTAKWEGGNPDCKHEVGRATRGGLSEFQKGNKGDCPHCGKKIKVLKSVRNVEAIYE